MRIAEKELIEVFSERYSAYALSTITARALPCVRDGLKPVHRRILYAMLRMRLFPEAAHKKSAKVVGDVMGNYHPHGDQAIYDAVVRLIQEFSMRVPLIEGQGNFGSIDGDNAAAMRYTESKLTKEAMLLLSGIDEEAVDFHPSYDEETLEPSVLPGAFPNLLINGASGIAVGIATSIPPHNPLEVLDACLRLLDRKPCSDTELFAIVKGPDFPSGGSVLLDQSHKHTLYTTGQGTLECRAAWKKEQSENGDKQIVLTALPYRLQKAKAIKKIRTMIEEKKLPVLQDIIDLSADDIRVILIPKNKNADRDAVMEAVFSATDMQTRFSLNMNAISAQGTPKRVNLRELLESFIDHRRSFLIRRSLYRLRKIEERLHILEALRIAYANIDTLLAMIRSADDPKQAIMEHFGLGEKQALALLNMRLKALNKLEEAAIVEETTSLCKELQEKKSIIDKPARQVAVLKKEINLARKHFAKNPGLAARRTQIIAEIPQATLPLADREEELGIFLSAKGWIRALKEGTAEAGRYKSGDGAAFYLPAKSNDRLILFTDAGRAYCLEAGALPDGRGYGEPVSLWASIGSLEKPVALFIYQPEELWFLASKKGYAFLCHAEDFLSSTRRGVAMLRLQEEDKALICRPAAGTHILCLDENRRLLVFDTKELPVMRKGKGVRLQKQPSTDAVFFFDAAAPCWVDAQGKGRRFLSWRKYTGKRGTTGKPAPSHFTGAILAPLPGRITS